ncbi:glycosyltransferase family 4 protein [Patescibacteria group bacterium]|nr:glycosyltransferase family 4 protein [Patescibacteria group bacterium]
MGGTDGVSLEIEKRKQILEKHGIEVKLIAGKRSRGADYIIEELEWDDGIIPIIKENGFRYFEKKYLEAEELKRKIKKVSNIIEEKLEVIQKKEKFDFVLIHNIFSFGGHIAAAKSFAKWIEKNKLPTIATHHDFFWERKEFRAPRGEYLKNYMEKYMPPQSSYIEHVVINSLAQQELKKRNNIDSVIIPDIFDFNQAQWKKDSFSRDFLNQFDISPNDLIILQATRVIPRKGIEMAMDFTKKMQENMAKLRGRKLYNGKRLDKNAEVVLVAAGYAEDEKQDYLFKLKTKAFDQRIRVKFISNYVKAERAFHGGAKTYSLWDAYVYADLVTFPSIWEGWGNQFIEAVFAKRPIVVFEYPVFKKDIEPEGYKFISLGSGARKNEETGFYEVPDKNLKKAVEKATRWFLDENLGKKLETNFKTGQKYHNFHVLENFLADRLRLRQ